MGVLNVTPDSFSDGGNYQEKDKAVAHALKLIEQVRVADSCSDTYKHVREQISLILVDNPQNLAPKLYRKRKNLLE